MKKLSSNRDLYEHLTLLSTALKGRGLNAMSDALDFAIGNAASSSTEFLGESRIALRRILKEENGVLTAEERAAARDVLRQLDSALGG